MLFTKEKSQIMVANTVKIFKRFVKIGSRGFFR